MQKMDLYYCWSSIYQESPNLIMRFKPDTCLFLFQTRSWISIAICRYLFWDQWFQMRVSCSFCC